MVDLNILLVTSAAPVMSPFSTAEQRMPIGIGFLISVLRNAGHKVFFIDNYLTPSNFLETDFLIKNKIDYIGISTNTICYRDTYHMFHKIEQLRQRGKWKGKIIVGGPHTSVALETIPDFVDYIVQGEGGRAILDILEGKAERIVKWERIKDLDSLPRPAYDLFANLPYDLGVEWFPDKPVFSMNTSRGCPLNCTFCSVGSIWGKEYRVFSAERIVSDIEYLVKTYGVKGIYFREDNFTLDRKRTVQFCDLLIKRKHKIKWVCETRVDSLDKDLIQLMYQAGCRALYLGAESGDQRILDLLKKGITVEQIRQVFKYCNKIRMKTAASFVVGVPTETQKEREQTIKFCKEIKPSTSWFNIFVGIPKSELHQYVLENKLYEYIDDRGLVYLKGHDELVDQFYGGLTAAKIPRNSGENGFIKPIRAPAPKVSIVMSVYNGEKYLKQAIDSILNQTFKDFEFLIINDGSTDRTAGILQSYQDPRIKTINNEKNIGLTKSLNKGLKIARGEYIARQDADDISLPQRLEKEVNFLEQHRWTGLTGSSSHFISESSKPFATRKVLTKNDEIKRNLIKGNQFGHGSVMFRRKCLDEVGSYREEFRSAQDYDLWLRISEKYDIANISEPLYKWRVSLQAISIAEKDEQDRYTKFARELARERREYGKDRLQTSSKKEIKEVLDNLFPKTKERSKTKIERIKQKNMAQFYQGRGLTHLFQNRQGQSRKQFLISLKYNPWNIKTYIYLCLTLFPSGVSKILRSGKKKLKSILPRGE